MNLAIEEPPVICAVAGSNGAVRLLRLAELSQYLGATPVAEEARELAGRVEEGLFYVACVGQFKRGKSTLINALIGQSVLPVGVTPVTSVPTIVRHGQRLAARVRLTGGSWRELDPFDLFDYVSEERNPQNSKGVVGVEVSAPSPLLREGLCLVDTPGLGSVFEQNSAATEAFIPHIDAALVVVGADPPLAGPELALIESIAPQVEHLIVVMNKADRATEAERRAAARFTQDLFRTRLHRIGLRVFEVSAAEQLNLGGPARDWPELNDALRRLMLGSGRQLVSAAADRGLDRLSEQVLAMIDEERDALVRPIEESEGRMALLKNAAAGAERALGELGFLWMAEQQRICGIFVERLHAFLNSTLPQARDDFRQTVSRASGPSYRHRRMSEAQEIARRHVAPWLEIEQDEAERQYRDATARFVQLGNELLQTLARSGLAEVRRMPHALDVEAGFRVRSHFSFAELIEVARPASPLRWLADVLLGWFGAHGVIERDAQQFLERLMDTNAARVQSDILDRLQESRQRLEVDIRKLLREIVRAAERALAQARQAKEAGTAAVLEASARLDRLEREVRALRPSAAGSP